MTENTYARQWTVYWSNDALRRAVEQAAERSDMSASRWLRQAAREKLERDGEQEE